MRVADLLKGPRAGAFLAAAARFASGGVGEGLAAMRRAAAPHDAAKWTILTYLPFLWRPETHLFLKPEVTKDAARRLGHPFAEVYAPNGGAEVYESLLDFGRTLGAAVADLAPADNIDLQGLIWVLGRYPAPQAAA